MMFIFSALGQTVAVIALAAFGVLLGRRLAHMRSNRWIIAYAISMLLMAVIAVPRWIPRLELLAPFKWIMADRLEYVVMAFVCAVLLSTPLYRLKNRRERIAVAVFMVFFIAYFSIMPFLMPVFAYSHLSRIETVLDCDNVCLQSNGYSCGPAAAVTVLKQMGVPAEEGALAISAHTTCFAGTPKDSLCSAIRDEYGVLCRIIYVENIDRLVGREPFIAVVKFGFLVDHYVAVLSIKDDFVVVGDPLKGLQRIPGAAFAEMWRKVAIMPDKVVREL